MNTEREYTLIEDPGHSWLEVPVKDVHEAGVYDSITNYSPIKRGRIYLEEDCDLYTFYTAMQRKGIDVKMNRVMVDDFDDFLANRG